MLEKLGGLLLGGQLPRPPRTESLAPGAIPLYPLIPESASMGNYPLQYWFGRDGAGTLGPS